MEEHREKQGNWEANDRMVRYSEVECERYRARGETAGKSMGNNGK